MTIVPLKHVAGINDRVLPESTPEEREFRYIDIGSVGRGELVAEPLVVTFGDAPSRARRLVAPGDTIVSTVRTYLRAVWPVIEPADDLVVSTGFAVLSPRDVDPVYFAWWVQSDVFIEDVVARSVGVSYPAINALELGEMPVRIPPLSEQRAIADYLDVETARIDALIAKKQQLIHLLEERWLGAIESEMTGWAEAPLKRVARIDYGLGQPPALSETGVPILRATNIERGLINPENLIFARLEELPLERAPLLAEGELLVVRSGAWTGDSALVTADWAGASPGYDLRVFGWTVDSALVAYQFLGERVWKQIDLVRSRAAQPHLNAEDLGMILIRIAPDRQSEVAALTRLESLDRSRQNAKAALAAQLRLLAERRQALITAAVTGELTVPGAA